MNKTLLVGIIGAGVAGAASLVLKMVKKRKEQNNEEIIEVELEDTSDEQ